jgi:hypothetical protein
VLLSTSKGLAGKNFRSCVTLVDWRDSQPIETPNTDSGDVQVAPSRVSQRSGKCP